MTRDEARAIRDAPMSSVEYSLARALLDALDRIEALEPKDGRPMSTDQFLVLVLKSRLSDWAMNSAIEAWVHGDWSTALEDVIDDTPALEGK